MNLNLEDIMSQANAQAYNNQGRDLNNQSYQAYSSAYDHRGNSLNKGYYPQESYRNNYNQPDPSYYISQTQSQSQAPRQNKVFRGKNIL